MGPSHEGIVNIDWATLSGGMPKTNGDIWRHNQWDKNQLCTATRADGEWQDRTACSTPWVSDRPIATHRLISKVTHLIIGDPAAPHGQITSPYYVTLHAFDVMSPYLPVGVFCIRVVTEARASS